MHVYSHIERLSLTNVYRQFVRRVSLCPRTEQHAFPPYCPVLATLPMFLFFSSLLFLDHTMLHYLYYILFHLIISLFFHFTKCPSCMKELKRRRPIQLLQPSIRLNRGLFSLNGLVAHLRTLLPKDFNQLEKPLGSSP